MVHKRKNKMVYWKTTWMGGEELDIYKKNGKIIATKDGKVVKIWKDDIRFKMAEIMALEDVQPSFGI